MFFLFRQMSPTLPSDEMICFLVQKIKTRKYLFFELICLLQNFLIIHNKYHLLVSCQNAGDTDIFVYKMNFLLLCEIRQLTPNKISPFEIISRHAPVCTLIKELYRINRESPGFLSNEAILTTAVLTHFSCHQFKFGFCYTLLGYTQNETAGKMWQKTTKILISLPYLDHKNLKLAPFLYIFEIITNTKTAHLL
jgi:hypothetical protein